MADRWEIGKEAQELDNKSLSERMKIGRRSIKKLIGALIIYTIVILMFSLFI